MKITTYCFICEAILKIVAQGFVLHRNSYLSDVWNCLDFFVMLSSVVEMIINSTVHFKGLRVLRVFRPLRTINRYPAMKRLVGSLGHALSHLFQTVYFIVVVFLLFSILGIKQFDGAFY